MPKSRIWLTVGIVLLVVVVGGIGVSIGAQWPIPWRIFSHYPMELLAEEAYTMNDCAECHETSEFHTCETCHDDHGAVEFEEVPFYGVVAFLGDVPEPGYLLIDDVLPYRDQPHTFIKVRDFLEAQGVTDFESVTFASEDRGFITVDNENLTGEAMLMPYVDGIRFAAEDLHGSVWIKGIRRIIVVGKEKPLVIDGEATSMGRLLLGPTRSVTVEQTEVMLKSDEDGQIRKGKTASRLEGAPLRDIVANPDFSQLVLRDQDGQEHMLSGEEAAGAILVTLRGEVTLVLPDRARNQWLTGIIEISSM